MTKLPTRSWKSWKTEVAHMLDGLPAVQYAAGIKRSAEASIEAGELTPKSYQRALQWADRVYWS